MIIENATQEIDTAYLKELFSSRREKILCTVDKYGNPNLALMKSPQITESGEIKIWINYPDAISLQNIKENKNVVLMAYWPEEEVLDYVGARLYAEVKQIVITGFDQEDFHAKVICKINKVRPVVDRGQSCDQKAV